MVGMQFLWLVLLAHTPVQNSAAIVFSSKFEVAEEQPVGSYVGSANYVAGGTYVSLSQPSVPRFRLHSNGNITTAVVLDRESLSRLTFTMLVTAKNGSGSFYDRVIITVIDVNDNRPSFVTPNMTVVVDENENIGTLYPIQKAFDPDHGSNGSVTYSITQSGNDSVFSVLAGVRDGIQDGSVVQLKLLRQLDREEKDRYSVTLIATDNGSIPLNSSMEITIIVRDVNDNPPLFFQLTYNATVKENIPAGSSIITAQASDKDAGLNGQITYSIKGEDDVLLLFKINSSTGLVTTLSSLDYETSTVYTFSILARNVADSRQESSASMTVHVEDVNDNAPKVSVRFVHSTEKALIMENQDYELVAFVDIVDLDPTPLFSEYRLPSLTCTNAPMHFRVDYWEGQLAIVTNHSLDRETVSQYLLTVTAVDLHNSSLSSSTTFPVYVEDQNDNTPVFNKTQYVVKIAESARIGSSVAIIHAIDEDVGNNGLITYTVLSVDRSEARDWFTVSNTSGLVQTTNSLDRETVNRVVLTIRATDNGQSQQNATAQLNVTILDANDNVPTFSAANLNHNISISESVPIGTTVIQLSAADKDAGKNGDVAYSVLSAVSELDIDSATGVVKTTQTLDREKTESYSLTVLASDGGNPALTSTVTLSITILDENDNYPVFSQSVYIADIKENNAPGITVLSVTARDDDSGNYGRVRYHLAHNSTNASLFSLDPLSGNVTALVSFDKEIQSLYMLHVSATDGGNLTSKWLATIEVEILNEKDSPPKFSQSSYNFYVVETDPVGTVLGTVSAIGTDNGRHDQPLFSIISGPSGLFNITNDGAIVLLHKLTDTDYDIVVKAEDVQSHGLVSTVPVHISVTDVNRYGPQFFQSTEFIQVTENTTTGSIVYVSSATDMDSGTSGNITYSLNSENFAIDTYSGEVRIVRELDRETVDRIYLLIEAIDMGYPPKTAQTNLTVLVKDTNDNRPVFSKSEYTETVSESVTPPFPFLRLSATDRDAGDNGIVDYFLLDTHKATFQLLDDGNLVVQRSLDREIEDLYNLSVIARDRGSPPLSMEVSVRVYVGDVNDHNPVFSNSLFNFSMKENTATGSVIGVMTADDADKGSNARLVFNLRNPTIVNVFSVNNKTGELIVATPVDFETTRASFGKRTINVAVVVRDSGSPSRSASTFVVVNVLDVNDNSPRFVSSISTAYVKENLPNQTFVAQFQAIDADSGTNGAVSYSLTGAGGFWVNATSGQLYTNTILDRESQDLYNMTIIVSDQGTNPLTSTMSLSVYVLDQNDWSPSPRGRTLEWLQPENVSVGTTVGRVQFEDRDLGLNSLLRYEITAGNTNQTFAIYETTGILQTAKLLDFESVTTYFMVVTAYDAGNPPLSGSFHFTINVTDVNDNFPEFIASSTISHVSEDASLGTNVTCLSATDADSSSNGMVAYDITTAKPAGLFHINSITGCIETASFLDRETDRQFVLGIRATDQAFPASERLSSLAVVTISISDVNDNYPLVTSPLTLSVYENTTVGSAIGKVTAIDADNGGNSTLTFGLGGLNNSFTIDPNTGDVTLLRRMDFDVARSHTLTVMVSDRGTPPLSSVTDITVYVLDSNNNAPKLTNAGFIFFVSELSPPDSLITVLTADDKDTGSQGKVFYSLKDNYGVFSLEPHLGALFLSSTLSYMKRSLFELQVVLTDGGYPVRSSTATIKVFVVDENDCTPSFNSSIYYASVLENSPIGSSVSRMHAVDGDSPGPNSNLTYSIVQGDQTAFHIAGDSGLVTVKSYIDREKQSHFELVIQVSDNGRPQRFNTTRLHVTVTDTNDNAPVVTTSNTNISLREDVQTPFLVTIILGADLDSGLNGHLTYKLDVRGNFPFAVNSYTGHLTLQSPLDYEVQTDYQFNVTVSDGGHPALISFATIHAQVLDANDHSPSFPFPIYPVIYVEENSRQGTLILQASARDPDTGLYGTVKYILADDSHTGHFIMNSISGRLTVAGNIDRETKSRYQMTVLAVDCDPSRPRTGSAQLLIEVTDANDHSPDFITVPYRVNLPTAVRSGTSVVTVSAQDDDFGVNSTVSYRVVEGKENFDVDKTTGLVTTTTTVRGGIHAVTIEAIDGGAPSLTGTAIVLVTIANTAYVAPKFSKTAYNMYHVDQNVHTGSLICTVTAVPAYSGHMLEYVLVSGNNASKFQVDVLSGNITVSQSLKDVGGTVFILTVMARDINSSTPSISFTNVNIVVNEEPNQSPRFSQPLFQGVVSELAAISTTVITISASDSDSGKEGHLSYSLSPSSAVDGIFAVAKTSGDVYTLQKLDREKQNVYNFSVLAVDQGSPPKTSSAAVRVFVSDVNDSPPVFIPTTPLHVTVPENALLGTMIAQLLAKDADNGPNAAVRYRLNGTSHHFDIDWILGTIWLTSTLDREKDDDYWLNVEATDGLHVTSTALHVTVLDVNDNSPTFSSINRVVKVPEQQGTRLPVLRVAAQDPDTGPAGNVSYRLDNLFAPLELDETGGWLTAVSNLTYSVSESNTHNITIVALDSGQPRLSAVTSVVIQVTDINNYGPFFQTPRYQVTVREDVLLGTALVQVKAQDTRDSLPLAQVRFSITTEDSDTLFWIHPSAGILTNTMTFDYESQTEYRVMVTAFDAGNPLLLSHTVVEITIADVNDNSPYFTADTYAGAVLSTSVTGSSILTVSAYDADSEAYGSVYYHIALGDPRHLFSIDSVSGEIQLMGDVRFVRSKEQFNMTVVAADGGDPPRSATATVQIVIVSTEKSTLTCSCLPCTTTIREDSVPGSPLLELQASEPATFATVGVPASGLFHLNQTSGALSLVESPDYDQTPVHRLQVVLTSLHLPPQYAMCNVTVHVTGINEFPPSFGRISYNIDVAETAKVGENIATVSATDRDRGQDGKVSYRVTGGNGSSVFQVSNTSAAILVQRSLVHKAGDVYSLHLLAVDGGVPRFNASTAVYLHVREANKPPFFHNKSIRVVIREDSPPGTLVARVQAFDLDDPSSNDGKLLYSIAGGNARLAFAIHYQTGDVTTRTEVDREMIPCYYLTIQAIDMGTPALSTNTSLTVCLEDVNDNGPSFESTETVEHLKENVPIGTVVLRLNVTDADISPNGGPFSFSLVNRSAPFAVNSSTGIVQTTGKIDREGVARYWLLVQARDNGIPRITSSTMVVIIIDDENDNVAQIGSFQVRVNLLAQSHTKLTLTQLNVHSTDVDDNVTCQIVNASDFDGIFSLDKTSCVLSSLIPSKSSLYHLTVSSYDGLHSSEAGGFVQYTHFSHAAVSQAVSLSVTGVTAKNFISYLFEPFQNLLTEIFQSITSHVGIISLQLSTTAQLQRILVGIIGTNSSLLPAHYIRNRLITNMSALSRVGPYSLDISDVCASSPCRNNGTCSQQLTLDRNLQSISAGEKTFIYQPYKYLHICQCPSHFTGERCEILDLGCRSNPCLNSATCIETPNGGYLCQCSSGFTGEHCDTTMDDHCSSFRCENGSTCVSTSTSYYCLCPPDKTGNLCELKSLLCSSSPCQNGGSCIEETEGYTCRCLPGYSGRDCRVVPYTFGIGSRAHFISTRNDLQNSAVVSLEFATSVSQTLLLTLGDSTSDSIVYVVTTGTTLDVQTTNGERTSLFQDTANGQWHRLQLEVNQTGFNVWSDDCSRGQQRCVSSGIHQTFKNISVTSLNLGSLIDPPNFVLNNYFVGSVRNVLLNGQAVEWSSAPLLVDVNPGSPRAPLCHNESCVNSGICIDLWSTFSCICLQGFSCTAGRSLSFSNPGYVSFTLNEEFFLGVQELTLQRSISNTAVTRRATASELERQIFSMQFSASQTDGILAVSQHASNRLIFLTMENNELVVSQWEKGHSVVSRGKALGPLAENTLHRVALVGNSTSSHVILLDNQVIANVADNLDLHSFISRQTVRIFIGGMSPSIQALAKDMEYSGIYKNFQGCLDQVSIDGILLTDEVASVSTANASVCEEGSLCIPSQQTENYCQCKNGFIPVDGQCKQGDPCINHCQNGGTCETRIEGHSSTAVISCICPDGFTGRLCETATVCIPNPCPTDSPTCIGLIGGERYRCVAIATNGESNDLSPVVVAVASLLGVLFSALIFVLFLLWYKQKRTKSYNITHGSLSGTSVTSASEMSSMGSSYKTIDVSLDSKEVKETSVDTAPYLHSNPACLQSSHGLNKQTTERVEDSGIPGENDPQEHDETNCELTNSTQEEITVDVHIPRPSAPVPGHCDSPDIDHSAQIPPGMDPDIISEAGASSFVDDGMVLPPIDVDSISDVVKLQKFPEYAAMTTKPRPPLSFYRVYDSSNRRPAFYWSSKQNTSTETSESLQGDYLPSSVARLAKAPIKTISPDSDSQVGSHRSFASVMTSSSTSSSTITGTEEQLEAYFPKETTRQTLPMAKMVPGRFSHGQALSRETVGLSSVELELLTPLSAAGSLNNLAETPRGRAEGESVSSDLQNGNLLSRTRGSLPAPQSHQEAVTKLTTPQLGATPSASAPVVFYPHETATASLKDKTQLSLHTVQALNSDSTTDCSTIIEFSQASEEAETGHDYPTVSLNLSRQKSIHRQREEFV
jgi:hypothetical protein